MDKILIADDNLQITRILSEFIRREGFEPSSPMTERRRWSVSRKIASRCCCSTS